MTNHGERSPQFAKLNDRHSHIRVVRAAGYMASLQTVKRGGVTPYVERQKGGVPPARPNTSLDRPCMCLRMKNPATRGVGKPRHPDPACTLGKMPIEKAQSISSPCGVGEGEHFPAFRPGSGSVGKRSLFGKADRPYRGTALARNFPIFRGKALITELS